MSRVYRNAWGDLKARDGHTVTIAAMTAAYADTADDVDLSSLGAGAESAASGYTRGTATLAWDDTDKVLRMDPTSAALGDLSDETDLAGYAIQDDTDNRLLVYLTTGEPQPGDADWYFAPDDGVVARAFDDFIMAAEVANHEVRITNLEAGGASSWGEFEAGTNVLTRTDGKLVKVLWAIGPVPVVAAGPAPVMIATVASAHRPLAPSTFGAFWSQASAIGSMVLFVDDAAGSALGTPGGVWAQDMTGDLTDADDVTPLLNTVDWWIA